MAKVIVEIGIPSIGQTLDFALPDQMPVETLLVLICESLTAHLKIEFPYRRLNLATRVNHQACEILAPDMTLADRGIQDGDKLMLI